MLPWNNLLFQFWCNIHVDFVSLNNILLLFTSYFLCRLWSELLVAFFDKLRQLYEHFQVTFCSWVTESDKYSCKCQVDFKLTSAYISRWFSVFICNIFKQIFLSAFQSWFQWFSEQVHASYCLLLTMIFPIHYYCSCDNPGQIPGLFQKSSQVPIPSLK